MNEDGPIEDLEAASREPEIAMPNLPDPAPERNRLVRAEMGRMSRRSFLWAGIAALGAYGGIRWLASRQPDGGTAWPFRRVLDADDDLANDYFGPQRLTRTYTKSDITELRTNETIGMEDDDQDFDPSQWTLTVNNVFGKDDPVTLTLADIKKLPSTTQITEFCCIEGWSMIVEWTGVRFVDFAEKYPPHPVQADKPDVRQHPDDLVPYVSMKTPNEGYYVGLDMSSVLHPQSLLCYAMNGEPLTTEHGAPLRLCIPVKYGIKNIKRIGSITYTDEKPADYWAEQGYDWYAGL